MSQRPKRKGAGQIDRFVDTKHFNGNKGKEDVVSEEEFDEEIKQPVYTYLEPIKDGSNFVWKDLEVKQAKRHGKSIGKGLFAKRKLKSGTIIVNLGKTISKTTVKSWTDERASHLIPRHDSYIDGKPISENYPNKDGIAFFGLSITNMINEPPEGVRPNCTFYFNQTVVITDVHKGEELLLFYGNQYNRSSYGKPYIISDETKWVTPNMWDWKSPRKGNKIWKKWTQVLEETMIEMDPKQKSIGSINKVRSTRSTRSSGVGDFWQCKSCNLLNIPQRNECLICFELKS